ncbi:hypothetical protein LUZ60_015829 [Juncus effusus]|nr:hypothetical protein LUZ60_015829 [Juncus effusus]
MEEKQMMIEEEEIVIVGGGIASLATAVVLKRVGFHSRVLESHSELRTTGAALTLAPNAWFALRALGVDHKLTSVYQSFNKSVVTNLETGVRQEVNNLTGKNDRQYLGRGIRAGFVPLNSKELYWFFLDDSSSLGKDISINPDIILKEVTENLAKDFPSDYLTVAKHADLSTLSWAPLLFRVPWNVAFGQAQNGNVTVAGDAFHPMNPDLDQGGCSSLEDAVVLARCLSQAQKVADGGQQWQQEGLKRYVEERRWRVTWIAAGSWFSGWSQKGGGNGENYLSNALRWFRDRVFYKFVFPRLTESVWFDCEI